MKKQNFKPGDRVVFAGSTGSEAVSMWTPGKVYVVNSKGWVNDDGESADFGGWVPGLTFNFSLAPVEAPAAEDKVLRYLKGRVENILAGGLPGDLDESEYGQFYAVSKALEDLYGVRVGTGTLVQIYFTQTPDRA